MIISFGFKENTVDKCIYHKISGSKFILLVLYVNDILLLSSDICLLHETKRFLSNNFEMKDLGNASFMLGIQIYQNRFHGILSLSQKAYIYKVLSRFDMKDCAPRDMPIAKGDKFYLLQCPRNEIKNKEMENIPYASAIRSLMYAQFCKCSNVAYIVGMLCRYLSNLGMVHWEGNKMVYAVFTKNKIFHAHISEI